MDNSDILSIGFLRVQKMLTPQQNSVFVEQESCLFLRNEFIGLLVRLYPQRLGDILLHNSIIRAIAPDEAGRYRQFCNNSLKSQIKIHLKSPRIAMIHLSLLCALCALCG